MILVPPDNVPHRCAVIPGRSDDPDGWIKTGCVLTGFDPEIEISVTGAKELGRLVGMVPAEEVEALAHRASELQAELALVTERLEKIETINELVAEVAA